MLDLIQTGRNPSTMLHAFRTALAALISLLIARAWGLPEAHWAPISALIVTQSTWRASLPISAQRFAGTAIGATAGATVAMFFPGNAVAFGATVFAIGALCTILRADRAAYRYAGIASAIVLLVPYSQGPWIAALHRFIEVSIGIMVGLALTAAWPEKNQEAPAQSSGFFWSGRSD